MIDRPPDRRGSFVARDRPGWDARGPTEGRPGPTLAQPGARAMVPGPSRADMRGMRSPAFAPKSNGLRRPLPPHCALSRKLKTGRLRACDLAEIEAELNRREAAAPSPR